MNISMNMNMNINKPQLHLSTLPPLSINPTSLIYQPYLPYLSTLPPLITLTYKPEINMH